MAAAASPAVTGLPAPTLACPTPAPTAPPRSWEKRAVKGFAEMEPS